MVQEHTPDAEVVGWLTTLGIASLCQWDLLVFLYRHQTSLVGADHLARLSGYASESVVAAMDALESLGLVGRSRVSQGARFYQFTVPSGSPRGEAFTRLLALASHRAGRLRLSRQLLRGDQTSAQGPYVARRLRAQTGPVERATQQQSQKEKRKQAWLKAI
jgi:hypothetical protein